MHCIFVGIICGMKVSSQTFLAILGRAVQSLIKLNKG